MSKRRYAALGNRTAKILQDMKNKKIDKDSREIVDSYNEARQREGGFAISDKEKAIDNIKNSIAPFYDDQVMSIININNESTIFNNTASYPSKKKTLEPTHLPDIYKELGIKERLFDEMLLGTQYNQTSKNSTGKELIENAISYDRISYSYNSTSSKSPMTSLNKAFEFLENAEKIATYDLEILGGTDAFGARRMDGITQFSVRVMDKATGKSEVSTTLVGLSEEAEKKYRKVIEDSRKDRVTPISSYEKVIEDAVGKMGHKDTKIELGEDGLYKLVSYAGEVDRPYTQTEINKGFENLRKIWKQQESIKTDGPLSIWEERFADMIKIMNSGDTALVDYNGLGADIGWINNTLADIGLDKDKAEAFKKRSGLDAMFLKTDERHLDILALTRQAQNVEPISKIYPQGALKGIGSNSVYSQETVANALFPDFIKESGLAAHSSEADTEILMKLITDRSIEGFKGKTYAEVLHTTANKQKRNTPIDLLTGNKALFMADTKLGSFNSSDNLSFYYDPLSDSIKTMNKLSFDNSGDIRPENITYSPLKKGRLYTIDSIKEMEMTDEWVEGIRGVHDDYAQKKLWGVKLNQVLDESVPGVTPETRGSSVLFFNSEDAVENFVSSMTHIGNKNPETGEWELPGGQATEIIREKLTDVVYDKSGVGIKNRSKTIEQIITESTVRDVNDPAARFVRENDYFKMEKFLKFKSQVDEYYGGEATAEEAASLINSLLASQDRKIAKQVASGEKLEISFEEVQNVLGYWDRKKGAQNLLAPTINNNIAAYDYLSSQSELFTTIQGYMQEKNLFENKSRGEINFIYNSLYSGIVEDSILEITDDLDLASKISINGEAIRVLKKDSDFFNIDVTDIYESNKKQKLVKTGLQATDKNNLRVNLNESGYSLINSLLNKSGASREMTPERKNREGIKELKRLTEHLKDNNEYRKYLGMFDNDSIESYDSAVVFAEDIIKALRDARSADYSIGLSTDSYLHNVTTENKVLREIGSNPELHSKLDKIFEGIPRYVESDSTRTGVKTHTKEIVDKLIDDIDAYEYTKQYGFTDSQAKYASRVYNQAKTEYFQYVENFIDSFTKVDGVSLSYDKKGNVMFFDRAGDAINLDLPKIKAVDGGIFMDTGSSRFSLHSVLDIGDAAYSNDPTKVSMRTTFGHAVGESGLKDTMKYRGRTANASRDPLGEILRAHESLMREIRKGSTVDSNDMMDIQSILNADIKDVMELLPVLKTGGYLDNRNWADPDFVDRIKEGMSFDKSNSTQRELFIKNMPEVLRVIADVNSASEDETLRLLANNVSTMGKDTKVSSFVVQVGAPVHSPAASLAGNFRPLMSTRRVLQRADEWDNVDSKTIGKHIYQGNLISSKGSKALRERNLLGGVRTKTDLTLGKANISQIAYDAAISDFFLDKDLNDKERKIFEKLKTVNLTEQEQVLNPRVADAYFNRSQIQSINSKKQLSMFMDINEETIKQVSDLNKMTPVFEYNQETQTISFRYKKGINKDYKESLIDLVSFNGDYTKRSSTEGTFAIRYLTKTDGIEVSEDEINKIISKLSSVEEAKAVLEDTFNLKYVVTPHDTAPLRKFLVGDFEKGMTDTLMFGMGELDDQVKSYLEIADRSSIGRTRSIEYIERNLLKDFNEKAAKASGIKNKEELEKKILEERYGAFDRLTDIFDREFHVLSLQGQKGHNSPLMSLTELVGSMQYHLMETEGLSKEAAAEKVYKDLVNEDFGLRALKIDGISYKDGEIFFPEKLTGGEDNIDLEQIRRVLDENYDGLQDGLRIKTRSGEEVGSFSMTTLAEIKDHQFMSTTSDKPLEEVLREYEKAISQTNDEAKIRILTKRRDNYIATHNLEKKGMKISDREMLMLGTNKYDQRTIDFLQDKMPEKDFLDAFGHVLKKDSEGAVIRDGRYVLDESRKGQAVLSDILDSFKGLYIYGQGDVNFDSIEDVVGYYSDSHVTKGIQNIVKSRPGISKETAEHIYSLGRGQKAIKYNQTKSYDLETMIIEGFGLKKASDIYTDHNSGVASLMHEDSLFSKNMLIDLGESFSEQDRYIAMPFVESSLYGDTVIREGYQLKAQELLNAHEKLMLYDDGEVQEKSRDQLVSNVLKKREELVSEIEFFGATGKEGLMGRHFIRMDDSFVGKASGLVALNPTEIAEYAEGNRSAEFLTETYNKALALFDGDEKEALAFINPKALSVARYNDKTLLENYAEGNYLNASFAGEQIFEEMGLLSKEYLKEAGFESKKDAIGYYEREGVSVIAGRAPTIYEDSIATGKLYLDSNLKDRRVKTLLEPALAQNADFDGDTLLFSVLKDKEGRDSVLARSSASSDEFWMGHRADMAIRGATSYQYYHDKVLKTLVEDTEKAFENANFFMLTEDHALNKAIFAEFDILPTEEGVSRFRDTINEMQSIFKDKHDRRFDLTRPKDISNLSDIIESAGEQREEFLRAAIFDQAYAKTQTGAMIKVGKNTIGEVNLPLFRLRMSANIALENFDEGQSDSLLLQKAFSGIEQEVISRKKAKDSLMEYYQKTEELKTALYNIASSDKDKTATGKAQMQDWMSRNMYDYFEEEYRALNITRPDLFEHRDDGADYMAKKTIDVLASFGTIEENRLKNLDMLGSSISSKKQRVNAETFLGAIADDDSTIRNVALGIAQESGAIDADVIDLEKIKEANIKRRAISDRIELSDGNLFEGQTPNARKAIGQAAINILDSVSEAAISKTGIVAAGLATAYMITGFVGSNASKPADVYASDIAESYQSLSDYESVQDYQPQGYVHQNTGYVINVSGNANQKGIKRFQDKFSQGIANSVSGDVNVKMNIVDSTGNINDRYLDELLADAIAR